MYRLLLVPLDGSPFAEHVLPLATSIARRAGASLQLLSVASFSHLFSKGGYDQWRRAWRDYLEQVVARVKSHDVVAVSGVFLEEGRDDVAPIISAHAKSIEADLIVMATHGRGGLGKFWLGSVPNELIHCSSRPLLLVKPNDSLPEWSNVSVPQHVLVPLDGSSLAEEMIEPAVTLGSLMHADYTLLRVINDIPMGRPELDSISLSSLAVEVIDEIQSLQKQVQKEAQDYLDGIAVRLRARGLQVQTRVMVANDPGTAILDEARAPGIDLVALETHGRRGLPNLVMGSVARKVIHGTLMPVLVQSAARACSDTVALADKKQ